MSLVGVALDRSYFTQGQSIIYTYSHSYIRMAVRGGRRCQVLAAAAHYGPVYRICSTISRQNHTYQNAEVTAAFENIAS